jgi:hypothetical protein
VVFELEAVVWRGGSPRRAARLVIIGVATLLHSADVSQNILKSRKLWVLLCFAVLGDLQGTVPGAG